MNDWIILSLGLSILDLILICRAYRVLQDSIDDVKGMNHILQDQIRNINTIGVEYAGQNIHFIENEVDKHNLLIQMLLEDYVIKHDDEIKDVVQDSAGHIQGVYWKEKE